MKVSKSSENRGILFIGTTRKIISQKGGFLNFLRPLMTAGLPLMKSVLTTLSKNVLIPLGLSACQHQMQLFKRNLWIRQYIMKIVKWLEESGLLIKKIGKSIKNEAKEQKGRFLSMLLGTLVASVLGNALAGKGLIRAGEHF